MTHRLYLVPEKVYSYRLFIGKRKNVHEGTAQREFSGFSHKISFAESFFKKNFTDDFMRQRFPFLQSKDRFTYLSGT